jgi:hypothetical protein
MSRRRFLMAEESYQPGGTVNPKADVADESTRLFREMAAAEKAAGFGPLPRLESSRIFHLRVLLRHARRIKAGGAGERVGASDSEGTGKFRQMSKRPPRWAKDRRNHWHRIAYTVGTSVSDKTVVRTNCHQDLESLELSQRKPDSGIFCEKCLRKN